MALMPVVTREMSALARRQSTYRVRSLAAVVAVLTMVWLLLVSASHVTYGSLGTSIFFMLSGFSFAFALLVGMQATADCVSEEKREGTLGLLFLTDLRPMDIVLGKMAASSLNAVFAMMGVVPMLALALLIGGVSLPQVALIAVILVNSMFLSLSCGLFVSTLSKNERKAMLGCFLGLFAINIMPFVLSAFINDFDKPIEEIVWVSPIYSFLLVQDTSGSLGGSPYYLVLGLAFQHLLGWAFLLAASRVLPKCINELPARRFLRIRTFMHNYVFGNEEVRKRHRAALLDRNAFLWLASRERIKPRYAWVVTGFFGLLFLWVYLQFPDMFFDPPVPLMIIFLVHFIFKLWTASEVCSRLINDRRSGALELLLSTPFSVSEIVQGQSLALRRIFRRPLVVLVAAELLIMWLTWERARDDDARRNIVLFAVAITTLFLDLWALKWVGLWLSLFGKSIERILIATLARVLAVPAILVLVIVGSLSAIVALQSESIPALLAYGIYWVISLLASLAFGFFAKRNFILNFREAATQRFDSAPAKLPKAQRAKNVAPAQRPPLWQTAAALMRRHWIITGSTIVVGLLLLIPFSRQLYWNHQVNLELRRIRAEGQPTSGAEVARTYTPLPSAENGFREMIALGPTSRGKGLQAAVASTQWFLKVKTNPVPVLEECRQLVSSNQANLAVFRELPKFQKGYIDPEQISIWMWPVDLGGYTSVAAADALLAISENDSERLLKDVRGIVALARLLRSQPLAHLQVNGRNTLRVLGTVLESAFARGMISSPALLELQLQLESTMQPEMLRRTLSIERARTIEHWGELDPRFGPPNSVVSSMQSLLAAVGTSDQVLALTLRNFRNALEASSGPPHELLRNGALYVYVGRPQLWGRMYGPWSSPNSVELPQIVYDDAAFRARVELLRAAIAAQRFQLENHSLPKTLQDLLPRYLEVWRTDTTSGERLQTDLVSGSFVIHSRQVNLAKRSWSAEQLIFELAPIPLDNPARSPGE